MTKYNTLLPRWAQILLREAAAVEDSKECPRAKDAAIEAAMHEIRMRCPEIFRQKGDPFYAVHRKK